ncbi:MAG: hypothetical protein WCE45_01395 [Sedimentisphaerales bacterium]
MDEWFVRIKKEWPVVKSAPYSFFMCFVSGIFIGGIIIFFAYSSFVLPAKDAQISLLQAEIAKLSKEKSVNNINAPVTKQEMRSFLESVNPEILKMVDAKQREIYVLFSDPTRKGFFDLANRPDFNKFLSHRKTDDTFLGEQQIVRHKRDVNDSNYYINELGQYGIREGYCLYPKDALIK